MLENPLLLLWQETIQQMKEASKESQLHYAFGMGYNRGSQGDLGSIYQAESEGYPTWSSAEWRDAFVELVCRY